MRGSLVADHVVAVVEALPAAVDVAHERFVGAVAGPVLLAVHLRFGERAAVAAVGDGGVQERVRHRKHRRRRRRKRSL